jgi:hypothetical protein
MENLLSVDVLRMFERHLVVIGGILAITFGYRLFQGAKLSQNSTSSVKTKLFEFTATKIGPGVFFAAFGTTILWTSLTHWFNPYDRPNDRAEAPVTLNRPELASLENMADRAQRPEDQELLRLVIKRLKRD